MALDESTLALWKRELAMLKNRPGDEARLDAIVAIRRSVDSVIPKSSPEMPTDDQILKAQLISKTLIIHPIALPPKAFDDVRRLALQYQERRWSLGLLTEMDADLKQLLSDADRDRRRASELIRENAALRQQREMLIHYLRLLDALVGKTAEPERTSS